MKKTILILIIFVSLAFVQNTFAQNPGYRCSANQCISCTTGQDGCIEGSCTAFTCDSQEDPNPPAKPTITNIKELEEVQSAKNIRVKAFGEANTRYVVSLDGQKVKEGSVGADGTLEATFNSNITENGEYKLEIYLIDNNDNESEKSDPVTIKIDASKPDINITNIPDFIGFESTLISGTTDPNSKVYVIQDTKIIYETGSDANGTFDVVLRGLKDGENKFVVKVVDTFEGENTKDISIVFDSSTSTRLELLSTSGQTLTFKVPQGIIAIEVFKNSVLIDTLSVDTEEFLYNLSDKGGSVSDKFEFFGIDAAGNRTAPTSYTKTNTTNLIIIVISIILVVGVVGLLIYLISKGKISAPWLKKIGIGSNQMKMDLNEETTIQTENIVPQNIRKEY